MKKELGPYDKIPCASKYAGERVIDVHRKKPNYFEKWFNTNDSYPYYVDVNKLKVILETEDKKSEPAKVEQSKKIRLDLRKLACDGMFWQGGYVKEESNIFVFVAKFTCAENEKAGTRRQRLKMMIMSRGGGEIEYYNGIETQRVKYKKDTELRNFLWRKNQMAYNKYEELKRQYDLCIRELGCYRWSAEIDDDWKIRVYEYMQMHRDEPISSIEVVSENQLKLWITNKVGFLDSKDIFR